MKDGCSAITLMVGSIVDAIAKETIGEDVVKKCVSQRHVPRSLSSIETRERYKAMPQQFFFFYKKLRRKYCLRNHFTAVSKAPFFSVRIRSSIQMSSKRIKPINPTENHLP